MQGFSNSKSMWHARHRIKLYGFGDSMPMTRDRLLLFFFLFLSPSFLRADMEMCFCLLGFVGLLGHRNSPI